MTPMPLPLVLMVDRDYIQILFFPFKDNVDFLVNCLAIPPIPIFIDGGCLNAGLFELIGG